jgi:hypothetical protein
MTAAIKALAKAQTEMGKALKNASNPHLKSKYADLGSVMDACFSALHANGFAVMQPCGRDEHGQYVETILAHESGETFGSRVHLVIGKADMQGVGSAITYARRYGLLGMAGLAPEDDDGEAQKAPSPRELFEADVKYAVRALSLERDLESLAAHFTDLYRNNRRVAEDPRVVTAKDTRKAELQPKDQAA